MNKSQSEIDSCCDFSSTIPNLRLDRFSNLLLVQIISTEFFYLIKFTICSFAMLIYTFFL